MPKYKVTKAEVFIVTAASKAEAEALVANTGDQYYDGNWTSVKELDQGWKAAIRKQLTGK